MGCSQLDLSSSADPPKVAACVGSGIIGSSWALLFAIKGIDVVAYDVDSRALDTSKETVRRMLDTLVANGAIERDRCSSAISRIALTTRLSDIVDAEYVQESVSENLEAKTEVIGRIEEVVRDQTVIASSTSGLSIAEMQRKMTHPSRALIAHPFNPPHLIPLVEIVPGEATVARTVELTRRLMLYLGKEPVLIRHQLPGFAANRIQQAIFREAVNLLDDEVIDIEDLEKVFYSGLGLRLAIMGQFSTFSLAGGPGGIESFFERYGEHSRSVLSSMREWSVVPEAARKKVVARAKELAVLRDHSYDDVVAWRDRRLIGLLRELGYLRY